MTISAAEILVIGKRRDYLVCGMTIFRVLPFWLVCRAALIRLVVTVTGTLRFHDLFELFPAE